MAKKTTAPKIDFDELDQQPATGILMAPAGMLGEQRPTTTAQRMIQEIPLTFIDPNPHQARKRFDAGGIRELADAMRIHGFTTVVWVRKHSSIAGRYQLVYGERRLRAARLVAADPTPKFTTIPCEVVEAPEARMKEIGLLENIQREDLLPEEEARAFRDLLDITLESGERPYSIRKLASQLGKDESYLQDRLFLLDMPADVKALYALVPDIALRTLREVCNLPTAETRQPILDRIRIERMAFAKVRELVQTVLEDLEAASHREQNSRQLLVSAVTPPRESSHPVEQDREEEQRERTDHFAPTIASTTNVSPPETKREAPVAVYTGLLRRDTKVIFPILDGWAKLLSEADDEVKQLVASTLEQVIARCSQLQGLLSEREQAG